MVDGIMAGCDGQTGLLASASRKFLNVIEKGNLITIEEPKGLIVCLFLL
jgi:hypothetical protein